MPLDDRRQRLDRRLEALARRDEPERREQETGLHSLVAARARRDVPGRRPPACSARAAPRLDRRAVRHDPDLLRRAGAELDRGGDAPSRSSRSRARPRSQSAVEHLELVRASAPTAPCAASRRAAARAPARTRATYSPSRAAEDPVLVLEQDDVDVEPAEQPRRANVVAARPPGRPSRGRPAAAGSTARRRRRRCRLPRSPRTPSSDARTSNENVPIPQARGGIRREDRGTHDSRAPLSVEVRPVTAQGRQRDRVHLL